MKIVGLFEAKQKLSKIVSRVSQGERIGITRQGKLVAMLVPPRSEASLEKAFADIERIRKNARAPKSRKVKDLIEEGRD